MHSFRSLMFCSLAISSSPAFALLLCRSSLRSTISRSLRAHVSISDAFDGGNIQLSGIQDDQNGKKVLLRIKPDPYTELEQKNHFQHFLFRSTVSNVHPGETINLTYVIENAGEASYAVAWEGYTVCFAESMTDVHSWRRNIETTYEDGRLQWTHQHDKSGSLYFGYFAPFTYIQHLDLIARCTPYSNVQTLGLSLEGREMDCITIGKGERIAWIIHRQHPGESMASHFAEGLLGRLLGLDSNGEVDGLVHRLLRMYTFYIVPCMCPDGAVLGHLRTNAAGTNLNREWASLGNYEAPTLHRSPEVYHVLKKMDETGVDVFVDVHGDEELPYSFLSGAEGTVNWGPRLERLHGAFLASYYRANSDIQSEFGYYPVPPGRITKGNIATDAIANRFNCLSATLEMPFKDCLSNSDPKRGWSPSRSRSLGKSLLDALAYIQPFLRYDDILDFPEEDRYIPPTHNYRRI